MGLGGVLRWEEEFPITLCLQRERESEFGICEKAVGCRSSVYHSRFKSRACQLSELISISVILAKEVKTFVVDNHKSEF